MQHRARVREPTYRVWEFVGTVNIRLQAAILPLPQDIEGLREAELAGGQIGTTKRGIAPMYAACWRLFIVLGSQGSHIGLTAATLPLLQEIDGLRKAELAGGQIRTTKRGIAPMYAACWSFSVSGFQGSHIGLKAAMLPAHTRRSTGCARRSWRAARSGRPSAASGRRTRARRRATASASASCATWRRSRRSCACSRSMARSALRASSMTWRCAPAASC